jgi:hypothetical protein
MGMSTPAPPHPAKPRRLVEWHRRVPGISLALFAFDLGIFLLIYPWLRAWDLSWIPIRSPWFSQLWMSSYFRGALSGLGVLNIYIAVVEGVKQWKMFFNRSAPGSASRIPPHR